MSSLLMAMPFMIVLSGHTHLIIYPGGKSLGVNQAGLGLDCSHPQC